MGRSFVAIFLLVAACGDGGHAPTDGPPSDDIVADVGDAPIDGDPNHPLTLADTGLCMDAGCMQISPMAKPYAPQYTLWSDGASKKRWIYLPAGAQIDTTNPNFWKFPVGTKLWKEFTRDGVRVETRLMMKLLADDTAVGAWFFASYAWNQAQNATTEATPGGMMNANGTGHDIPSRQQCRRCHENTPGRVLGFQALSLDFQEPTGGLDLDDLIGLNALTTNPPSAGAVGAPHYPLPGNPVDKAAFGYVHANCGGCHNQTSSIYATTTLELRMDVTKLGSVAMMPARITTLNVNGTVGGLTGPIVAPMNPAGSVIITRMTALTSPPRMPEIGTEVVDQTGVAAVTAWINQQSP
jgi:hypothetical protein